MATIQRLVTVLPTLMQALRKETPPQRRQLMSLQRAFSIYDQINLIDNIPEDQLLFQEIDGFKINGVKYEGSLICMGNFVLSWAPKKFSDINAQSPMKILKANTIAVSDGAPQVNEKHRSEWTSDDKKKSKS